MSKIALVFPGQGSQAVGMGKDFYEKYAAAKGIIDKANTILQFDIKSLMFNGPIEELTRTENTQPALLITSIAILEVLKQKGLKYFASAGHSLGEYSAYVAAGKLEFDKALQLVRKRGELMSNADPEKKGGMGAVMAIEDAKVEEICKKYSQVVPANYNCPGQLVISGDKIELEKVYAEIKATGGKVIPLNVSGPFHSPLMKKSALEFEKYLLENTIKETGIPVYANLSACPVESGQAIESLKNQIFNPVRWTQTIQNMIKDGFDTFIEVGPGKVLQGLMRKIDKTKKILGVADIAGLEKLEI